MEDHATRVVALLPLAALLGWYCLKERVGAMLLATFFAAETIFIVHSRIGVMDIFVVFFVLAAFLAALWAESSRQVIFTSVLLGLAVAVKWAAFPVAVPIGYVLWRKGLLRSFLGGLWILRCRLRRRVYVGALTTSCNQPELGLGGDWHVDAARKVTAAIPHTGLALVELADHAAADTLFTGRTRRLFQVVLAIGNPLIWWSSTLAVVVSIFEIARKAIARKLSADDPIIPIVLGYVFLLAPWVAGTRIPTSTTTCPSTPSPSWRWSTGYARSGTSRGGVPGGRRLYGLHRGADRILPPAGPGDAHKRGRPHAPRVDRLLVLLRETGSW